MKSFFKILTVVIGVSVITTGCKKGENDPFLSLKSRTSRLCQEWKLSAADYTESYVSSSVSTSQHYTYDGTNMTEVSTYTVGSSSTSNTDVYPFSIEYEFTKEGTFDQITTTDGTSEAGSGIWNWLSGNKETELKNKEAIVIAYTSGTGYTIGGVSINPDQIIVIDKLSSDELIVLIDYTMTDDGDVSTSTGTMTFTKK